jgi:hypothetical protein
MGYKTWTDIMLLDGNDAPRRTLDLESSSQVSDPDVSQRTSVICFSSGTEGLSKGVESVSLSFSSLPFLLCLRRSSALSFSFLPTLTFCYICLAPLCWCRITHYNLTSLCSFMRPPIMPTIEPGKDILLGILVRPFSLPPRPLQPYSCGKQSEEQTLTGGQLLDPLMVA